MILRRKPLKPRDYDRCGRKAPRVDTNRIREEIRAISDFPLIVREEFLSRRRRAESPTYH